MESPDTARIIYLTVLLGAVAGYYILANRRRIGQMLRHAMLWAMIFVGVLAGLALWQDIRPRLDPRQISTVQGVVEVPRGRDGHYSLVAQVNGKPVAFLVDTGATSVVLSHEDAARVGIDVNALAYTGSATTANGIVQTAPVWLDSLTLEGITDEGVRAYVSGGQMSGSLLGMDYLGRFAKIEITQDRLILTR